MLRKRFLGWNEPALSALVRTLAEPEAGYADPPVLDLRSQLFVLPGGRAGRRLVEILVQEAEDRGLRLTPPRVVTVGALPELLYRHGEARPPADPVLSRQLWTRALRDTHRDRMALLVPDPPEGHDPAAWAGLADAVMELHAEVAREGLDFEAVAKRCGGELLFDDSERWRVLAAVRRRYLESVRAVGRADIHEARIRALAEGWTEIDDRAPDAIREIHLVGIAEMPGVTRSMLRQVAAAGTPVTAWIKAPNRLEGRFDDVGCVDPESWKEVAIPVPDDVLIVEDGPADQATAALRAIADFDGGYGAEEIAVGVPDEDVIPWLEQRFRSHGLPHRVAEGTPLERTSVYRLLEAVADYIDGRRFVDLAALLRHPDLGRRLGGSRVLEIADKYHSTHLPARVEPGMPHSRETSGPGGEPSLRVLLDRLQGPGLLGPLADDGERSLSDWMPPILAVVDRIFGGAPLHRQNPEDRTLIETCRKIRDLAASFHRLPSHADPACVAPQAIRLLLGQLRVSGAPIPPEPNRAAMELLGWLELHLDDAPALVVTGFNEGFVPESVNAHLFLPNALRSALGLVDNRTRWARDAYLLSALLESREVVRIVAGRTTGSGDPLRPSRLLLGVRGEALARRVLRFVGTDREPSPPVRPPEVRVPDRSAFATPPEPEIRLTEVPASYSVTEFRALVQDPYRWLLERRLALDTLDDGIRELDPLGFGSLAHDVLRDLARTDEVVLPDPEAVRHRLDRILDTAARRRFGPGPLPSVPLQIEQLRHRLHAFADWHASRVAAGWRVIAAEIATPEGGVPFDVDGRPIRIRGRIDRIEIHRETGAVAVFDYKTGDRVQDPDRAHRTRSGEWRDLQLPLYRYMLPHLRVADGGPVVEVTEDREVHLGYIRISKDPDRVGAVLADWSVDDLRSALERAREVIRSLRDDPVVAFDRARSRTSRWDPLGPLLGRGTLSLASREPEEDE